MAEGIAKRRRLNKWLLILDLAAFGLVAFVWFVPLSLPQWLVTQVQGWAVLVLIAAIALARLLIRAFSFGPSNPPAAPRYIAEPRQARPSPSTHTKEREPIPALVALIALFVAFLVGFGLLKLLLPDWATVPAFAVVTVLALYGFTLQQSADLRREGRLSQQNMVDLFKAVLQNTRGWLAQFGRHRDDP